MSLSEEEEFEFRRRAELEAANGNDAAPEKPFMQQVGDAFTSRQGLRSSGAMAGSLAGGTLGIPLGPLGIAGGSLLGGMAGSALGDFVRDMAVPEERPTSVSGALSRFAGVSQDEALAQAVGYGVSPVLGAAGRGIFGAGKYLAEKLPITGGIMKAAQSALAPFTEEGARVRAERAMQGLVSDPVEAASKLGGDNAAGLTPAQRIGGEKILGVEKKIASQTPQSIEEFAQKAAESQAILRNQMKESGSIAKTREFVEGKATSIADAVAEKASAAVAKAEGSIAALSPEMRGSQASMILRNELETALKTAKVEEKALWDAIPGAGLQTTGSRKAYSDMVKSLPKAQMEDIPSIAKQFLDPKSKDKFIGLQSASELQGLRSKLLEESRVARAAGQYNKARIADNLADGILDDLGAQSGKIKGPVGKQLREALDYTRALKEKFNQGPIGRVLSSERTGADSVAPELTMQTILGAGKVKGDVGLEAALKAADTPETRGAVQQYMLERLNAAAVKDGKLNPALAKKFFNDNVDILDKFPDIRKKLSAAISLDRDAARLLGREKSLASSMNDPAKSATARFLKAPVEKEIEAVYKAQDPGKAARDLRRMVIKDPEAMQGLRAATMEDLVKNSHAGVDDVGNPVLSGGKIMSQLSDKRKRPVLMAILGEEKLGKLENIASQWSKLEAAQTAKEAERIISDKPNIIIEMLVTTAGARFGAKLGAGTSGASLKTSSFMSNKAREFVQGLSADRAEALLIQAFTEQDGELMKSLLLNTTTPQGKKKAAEKFSEWFTTKGHLLTAGTRVIGDIISTQNEEGD